MRVFVTGASGFIGGKICDRLEQMDVALHCCGRRSCHRPGYFSCDLSNPLKALPEPIDVVVHAAARSSPWGSKTQFYKNNIQATQNVVDFCRKNGRPKLVFISSSSIYYRSCDQWNITEASEPAKPPINRYAGTKQIAEKIIRSYEGPWAILRPRAVFGPDDTVLLPRILAAARQGRLPLFTTQGNLVVGDLIYIDNLVDYVVQAITSPHVVGDFNLTNNQPIEINAFLLDVFRQLDIPEPKRRVSVRTAMLGAGLLELFHHMFLPWKEPVLTRFGVHVFAYSKTFNVAKSIAVMGEPKVSIEEGVRRTVESLKFEV